MKRFKWQNIRIVLIVLLMVFLYSFSSKRNNNRILKGVNISFVDDQEDMLITNEMVNNFLTQKLGGTLSIEKDKVDLQTLEIALTGHDMIEKAEVFSTIDGFLNAQIKQKTPIVRYTSGNTMCYLDNKGNKMPLSESFSARVPLVTGTFDDKDKDGYVLLFNEIYNDDFLKKNITGAKISPAGNVILSSRNYNYKIIFGKPVYVEKKLENYKAFFYHAVKDTLITHYKEVNVMFTEQVVCKK
ncbi:MULTISPECIES: cell division protein FtsQ/DivIB [Flavobacterium]|uniref:Cell division protein FtsQ/DivIB n=1 Tax=Flavobacterium jumunjinense TaxID=998845 RepID=A0ABV5GT71_9FLAO|nr:MULTISPECIES: cell division protein FtsQ [Flavobacterium]